VEFKVHLFLGSQWGSSREILVDAIVPVVVRFVIMKKKAMKGSRGGDTKRAYKRKFGAC
jgi:hypothetical protein